MNPIPMILGTDWWTDCDDVAAVRLMAKMHHRGTIRLLGVILNACMDTSAPSLDAMLTSEGLPGMPLGLDPDATDFGRGPNSYQARLATLPHTATNQSCMPGVSLYRKLLAESPVPVDIVEIGYPQVLSALLESKGDQYSPLDGIALVQSKVRHLWMMAGNWEKETGRENNFARNARSRAGGHIVCEKWPTDITFLGWEVGFDVITGNLAPEGDILHQAMADIGFPNGRSSWDPMLCLLACIGDPLAAGYTVAYGTASVDPDTGDNHWTLCATGRHRYVIKARDNAYYAAAINALL